MSAPKPWERARTSLNSTTAPEQIITPSQSTTTPDLS